MEQEKAELIPYGTALSALWLCNIAFVLVAWFMVFMEPLAGADVFIYIYIFVYI